MTLSVCAPTHEVYSPW